MAQSWRSRAVLVAVAAVVVAACGGSTSSSSSSSGSGAGDPSSFVSSYCAIMAPCCATVKKPTDGVVCRSVVGAFTSGDRYDSAKGAACLSEMNAAKDAPGFCDGTTDGTTPDCKAVFTATGGPSATKKPGDLCSSTKECAASSEGTVECQTYFGTGGAQTLICQIQIAGKIGDTPCIGTRVGRGVTELDISGAPVPRGYICDHANGSRCDTTTKACAALVTVGAPCSGVSGVGDPCTVDAFCDFQSGKCATRVAKGGACTGSSASCQDGLYCDASSKACATAIADGQPCAAPIPCASSICVNGICGTRGSGNSLGLTLLCGS